MSRGALGWHVAEGEGAAPERGIEADAVGEQRAPGLHQLLLGREQIAFGVKHVEEGAGARIKAQLRQAGAFGLGGQ